MTELQLNEFEDYINQNRRILTECLGNCSHIKSYQSNQNFKFLPGHKLLLLKVAQSPPRIDKNQTFEPRFASRFKHPGFSTLLQHLIETALNNFEKAAANNRYSDLVMDFAIYIYIMAGKACYEIIAANLPLPSAVTIRNYYFQIIVLISQLIYVGLV